MELDQVIKKIRIYSIVIFLLPLIAINSCLILYKTLGNIQLYPDFQWNKKNIEKTFKEFNSINVDYPNIQELTYTKCPKYIYAINYISDENKIIEYKDRNNNIIQKNQNLIKSLQENNKIKSVTFTKSQNINTKCVKNYKITYKLLNYFPWLEKILLKATERNSKVGFAEIKNPYIYGEVSISRTARYFPATYIFKTLIILSSIFLFLYWKNNLNLFNELKNKKILDRFSKNFFYLGVLSCIFLILHASFLGLDFDSKLFDNIRRIIIILFIFSEIFAQIFLTINIFRSKDELRKNINYMILNIKIIYVLIIFVTTCISFLILAFADPSSAFKHALEWNYFSILLIYYFLSRILWKYNKQDSSRKQSNWFFH